MAAVIMRHYQKFLNGKVFLKARTDVFLKPDDTLSSGGFNPGDFYNLFNSFDNFLLTKLVTT